MLYWAGGILVGAFAVTVAMAWLHRGSDPDGKYWRTQLANMQALLTIAAVLLTGVWYFFERPTQPKLTIDQEGAGIKLGDGRVLVLAEVSIENVGDTAINFEEAPMQFFVHQVMPLTPKVGRELSAERKPNEAFKVASGDDWEAVAVLGDSRSTSKNLRSEIEAGETEQLYFRVALPCKPGLQVYLNTRLPKPGRKGLYWTKQTLLDLGEACS